MEYLKIKGGVPLCGSVKAAGAKNSVTKLLVASLITDKKCVFYNVPNIMEVEVTLALCRELGAHYSWDKQSGIIEIQTKELKNTYVPQRFCGANRIPILVIGALLGRTDEDIIVPTVGGCPIGKRPVDFHIDALTKLGAHIEYRMMKKEGAYLAHAHKGLTGTEINLPFPSVGATENTILAASRAKGSTIIRNAAMEPEIMDLILFLQKLGINIHVDVNRTIIIKEAKQFYDVEHTVITDRIEAASFGMAAISTKGSVFVEGAKHEHMVTFLNKIREIGGGFKIRENGIEFFHTGHLKGNVHVETNVHPGFMTDWQQPFVVLLTQTEGYSVVHETVYENRFGYTETLKEMGANIQSFTQCLGNHPCRFGNGNHHHSIVIKGATPLQGKDIAIPDLRAGFAYVMAGLISEDTSRVTGLAYLDRGYENLVHKLSALGAQIERTTDADNTLPKHDTELVLLSTIASVVSK